MSFIKSGNLPATLAKISHLLAIQKKQGYIVGGFIRDWLLERKTNDIDIAVSGAAITIRESAERDKSSSSNKYPKYAGKLFFNGCYD